jgi:hypothetical protein
MERTEIYVVIAWSSPYPGDRRSVFREEIADIESARKVKDRLREQFAWCDVQIYHSPELGVMRLVY